MPEVFKLAQVEMKKVAKKKKCLKVKYWNKVNNETKPKVAEFW